MNLKPLRHVSASQIKTFSQCARKHWFEKIMGIEVPVSAGAQFGTRGHTAVETRIQTGAWPTDDPEAVQRAMAGWKFVPQNTKLLVEEEMQLDDAALPVIGRVDLVAPHASVILDHKFMSSFRYAKTPAQLRVDPQAILYSTWGVRAGHLRPREITFRHITYLTRGNPDAQTSQVQFEIRELQTAYDGLRGVIDRMVEASHKDDPRAVQGAMESSDPSPCEAYGGCPHKGRCLALTGKGLWGQLGVTDKAKEKEDAMNLLDKLKSRKAAPAPMLEALPLDYGAINPPDGTDEAPAPVEKPKKAKAATKPAPGMDLQAELAMEFTPVVKVGEGQNGKRTVGVVAAVNDALAAMGSIEAAPDLSFPPTEAEMADFRAKEARRQANASTLFIGCLPSGEGYDHLDNWLAPLLAQAAETMGVDHYTQADFGKGKAALLALIVHRAKAGDLPTAMVVDPRSPSADLAVEILRPHYGRVIQRFS